MYFFVFNRCCQHYCAALVMNRSSSTTSQASTVTHIKSHRRVSMSRQLCSLVLRGSVLFTVGVLFALVLNLLQVQRHVTHVFPDVVDSLFSTEWWIPPSVGIAAGKYFYNLLLFESRSYFAFKGLTVTRKKFNVFFVNLFTGINGLYTYMCVTLQFLVLVTCDVFT